VNGLWFCAAGAESLYAHRGAGLDVVAPPLNFTVSCLESASMPVEPWLAFVVASVILLIIPGPTVLNGH